MSRLVFVFIFASAIGIISDVAQAASKLIELSISSF
jgi:hypothetical protein